MKHLDNALIFEQFSQFLWSISIVIFNRLICAMIQKKLNHGRVFLFYGFMKSSIAMLTQSVYIRASSN